MLDTARIIVQVWKRNQAILHSSTVIGVICICCHHCKLDWLKSTESNGLELIWYFNVYRSVSHPSILMFYFWLYTLYLTVWSAFLMLRFSDSYVSLGNMASVNSSEQRVDGWEHQDRVEAKRCLLSENTSLSCSELSLSFDWSLPAACGVTGLKNGFQGQVTSWFRGQHSVSLGSPFFPDTEDKAHIESTSWKPRASQSALQYTDVLSG